ncbi:MAG: hypothetical protein OEZ23_00820 [Gammaproteobacteria bacterium]|nr:hypothetical protein [Gammaproteobacteria bacterium]
MFFSVGASADLTIQNVIYNANSGSLHVKGKVNSDTNPAAVYVYDARSNLYLGSIDTYARNRQFKADFFMSADAVVPCFVRVQILAPYRGRGGLSRTASRLSSPTGEFDISEVNQAPAHCDR